MHCMAARAAAAVRQAEARQCGGSADRHCRRRCPRVLAAAAAGSSGSNNTDSGSPSSPSASSSLRAMECSLRLAAVRAAEQQRDFPLFADAFSAALVQAEASAAAAEAAGASSGGPAATGAGGPYDDAEAQREALATRFLDEQLLKAVTIVNLERDLTQEYNQVVLVGDGMDTRPFRLPWPEGTVIFCVAPAAVHQRAEAAFKAQQARAPRGCLLRRVSAELAEGGSGFAAALERAGFRGDRLSVWVLQGIGCLGLGPGGLTALLTDICNLAAFDSLVAGLLPPMQRRALDNLLASFGLLGAGVDFGQQTDWGRWAPALELPPDGERPWLFVAQQKRLSVGEMGVYEDHVAAAEEVDEDFFGNFS